MNQIIRKAPRWTMKYPKNLKMDMLRLIRFVNFLPTLSSTRNRMFAHALHNLLIWLSIAYPAKDVLALQSKGTQQSRIISFSDSFMAHNKHFPKTIFKVIVLLLFLLSIPAFAAHNSSVSHSASGITNGTFQDNYTFTSYAQNATSEFQSQLQVTL